MPDKKLPTTVFGAQDIHKPQAESDDTPVPILDTKELAVAIHTAHKHGYRRSVDPFFADKLDPQGWHVVGHHVAHAADTEAPFVRCQLLCCMKQSHAAKWLWLDIDMSAFMRYRRITVSELQEGRNLGRFK